MAQQCTARAKSTGKRCTRPAVAGTDKCRLHGGLTPVKHGLYSKYSRGRLAQLIEANRDDPQLTNIREHLALLAALAQDLAVRVGDRAGGRLTVAEREALARLADRGIDGIKKLTEVEKGLTLVIRPETFDTLLAQIGETAQHVFRDHPDLLAEFARRLAALGPGPPGPAPDAGGAA